MVAPVVPITTVRPVRRPAFTLVELMAALAIIGLLAVMALPRTASVRVNGHRASCHVNLSEIELQAILWMRVNGSWPATNLADIGNDTNYFPEGLPTCPVDGSAYTIDASGKAVGHTH